MLAGSVPSLTVAPARAPARRSAALERLAGASGLVFVVLLVVQNVVRSSGPSFTASPANVVSYFADHRAAVLAPLALFPLGMVALLCFAAGIWTRARVDEAGRFWAIVGGLAVAVLAALFSLVNIIEIVIAANGNALLGSPQVVGALWTVHSAAFGLNLAAIAVALVGLSRAAVATGLIPRALALVALPGAACLFVAAVLTVAIAEGSHWLYLGYLGFIVWGVFLVAAGASLLLGRAPAPSDDHSASSARSVNRGARMTASKSTSASAKTMNTVIHAAFRRDLQRFEGALAAVPARSRGRADLLHAAWTNFSDQLRHHHHEEEEIFFPALRELGADALLLTELTEEHVRMLAALDATEAAMRALHVDPSTARAQDAGAAMAELGSAMQVHLGHEERDLEPFSARRASTPELKAAEKAVRTRARRRVGTFIAWLTDGAGPVDIAVLRRTIPPPALFLADRIGGRHYRRTIAVAWSGDDGEDGADGTDG